MIYCYFPLMHDIWRSLDVWFRTYGARRTFSFLIMSQFLPFYSLNDQKVKNKRKRKKEKKTLGDVIILHVCTTNDDDMIYGSREMECKGQHYLSFCVVFCPFIPLTTWKFNFWKNEKNTKKQNRFTQVDRKTWSYAILFLRYDAWRI